jgi:hypothetical protein
VEGLYGDGSEIALMPAILDIGACLDELSSDA